MIIKIAAILLTSLGAICLGWGAIYETAPSGYVNLHAVSQQQKLLLLGGFAFVAGVILLGFERLTSRTTGRENKQISSTSPAVSGPHDVGRNQYGLQDSATSKSPLSQYALRLAVGSFVGLTIASLIYNAGISENPPVLICLAIVVLSLGYSMIPGNTARRLKQLLWLGIVVCAILFAGTVQAVFVVKTQGYVFVAYYVAAAIIAVLGMVFFAATRFIDKWVLGDIRRG